MGVYADGVVMAHLKCRWILLDDEFNATVLLATFGCVVVRDGAIGSESLRAETVG